MNTTKDHVQKFGRFLSGMIMPNIGAFIAWGLITALFIPTGWVPNEALSNLVGPMILYLLPLLIGYTGGYMVYGARGAVIGAVATMGIVVGVDIPMFIGAMIMGPISGLLIKKFDETVEDKIPSGFEMLVNNFSSGMFGLVLAVTSYKLIGPSVLILNTVLKSGVQSIVNLGLLPFTSIFIEPGKILFLNNAINHGILGPLGIQQANELGKSIFFLLETNPGPGLGILLAYWVFSDGLVKQSSPGAIIIHFLGGIHEIYFPYVLMRPILILPVILGGMSGVFTFSVLGAGLIATPSPGSIFALLAMTPKGSFFAVIAGVLVSTLVTFFTASIFMKSKSQLEKEDTIDNSFRHEEVIEKKQISKIVFACDAGMGSSAMGSSILKSKFENKNIYINIQNEPVDSISSDADIVICHKKLLERAKKASPNANHLTVDDFLDKSKYDDIVEFITTEFILESNYIEDDSPKPVLDMNNILLNQESVDKDSAIRFTGSLLSKGGYVEDEYIEGMIRREEKFTTYIGNGVAIPHGENDVKDRIKNSGIVVVQYPNGIDFGEGNVAHLLIGLAGKGNEHILLLANIADAIEDESIIEELRTTNDKKYIYDLFSQEELGA